MHLVTLDYLLLGAFLLLMVFIGSAFGWLVKDAAGFLKGGNTIPWFIAGTSNFMSMFSTFVFVAYAGIAYQHGFVAISVFWSTVVACLVAATFFARRWRRADLTTPVEYLERRFNFGVRQTFSWLGLFLRFLDNAVRLYASGLFLATVTPLSMGEAVMISGILITIFAMIGGLWAVVVMDTIQFIVLIFATLILVPLSLAAAGGFDGIAEAAPENLNWFNSERGAPLFLLVYYLMVTLKYNSNWSFIQRLYAVRDEGASRKVALCSALLFFLSPLIFLLPAIAARVILPDLEDPEQAYVAVCVYLLPAGMMGLMLAAMFSATVSALNSEFNVMAGVLTNDVYQRFLRPASSDRERLWVARGCTVLVGGCITAGAFFVADFGGAFEANKLFTSLFALPLAIPLIFGLVSKRPTALGAVVSVFGGATLALVLHLGGWLSWEWSTLLVCGVTFALLMLVSGGARTAGRQAAAADFFRQVDHPLPPERIPTIDPRFKVALGRLFALSFAVSGGFFLVAGGLNAALTSGQLALAAGCLCLILGGFCWRTGRPERSLRPD
ncbi:MAG: sodium:solute symporter family transporter [Verrucomicrobiota bacterium]